MKILLLFITISLGINAYSCEIEPYKMALPIGAKYTDVYIPIEGASLSVEFTESEGSHCIKVDVLTENKEAAEFNYKFEVSEEAIEVPFYAIAVSELEGGRAVFKFRYNPDGLESKKITLKVEILSPYGGTKVTINEKFTIKH